MAEPMGRSAQDRIVSPASPLVTPKSLYVGRPNAGDRQSLLRSIEGILERNWLTNDGPLVREFEQRIANSCGVKHCVAMCNGTVALELAMRAAGLHGEVIVPAYTFVATAHAVVSRGLKPVMCDVDPATHNIDPSAVKRLITPNTSAIVGVHLWGTSCDTEALEAIAKASGVALMYDAAHAFGCAGTGGRMIGAFGLCEVFSFHATKFVHCGEGGAVVTNDDALADRLRLLRNFGFAGYDNVVSEGTNGKMSEFAAAVGLTLLDAQSEIVEVNRNNYDAYREALADVPGLKMLEHNVHMAHNFQYIVCEIDEPEFGLSRDCLVERLHANNIMARRYFFPGLHRMAPYHSMPEYASLSLPATEALVNRVVVLPTGTQMTPTDATAVCGLIRHAAEGL